MDNNSKENNEFEIDEISDEIDSALKDKRGLSSHQRRLAFCLSLGIVELVENYLRKKEVLKKGYKIDHRLFKKSKYNIKSILAEKITCQVEKLDKLDRILDVAFMIESKRNEVAYGKNVSNELLLELINLFLDIKKEVDND